ncbi:tyrosine recombinase XerC [Rhodohalobacter sp. 614A]|uniref:tyrosine recombinase XerC n=1 Tax=Rhodohalobacter sp. 614A TaxID=2908649 RepID=UPI001F1F4111|nr:tyrosine recombinase XerC [Rhodohalobacter sp. 614A]
MKELIDKYLKYLKIERNSSDHTITSYQNDLTQLLDFTAQHFEKEPDSVDVSDIDRLTIRLWLGELTEEGMARNTIARKVAAVRSFFKYCYKRSYITKNPAHLLIIPKKEKRLPKIVQAGEINEMMELASDPAPETVQERAILELFYSTGIRLSELTNLNVKDIQIHQHQLTVLGKGSKQRIVPLGDKALDAIKNHLQTRSELFTTKSSKEAKNALFLSVGGNRIYPRMVQRIIKKYLLKVSEVTQKSPHTLRHSFATHMLDAGADIRLIKEFLGHANLASTQIYTHTSVERLQKIYSQAHPRAENKS